MFQGIKIIGFATMPRVIGTEKVMPVQNAAFNNLKFAAEGSSTYITRAFDAALASFSNVPNDVVKKVYLVSDLDDTANFEQYTTKFKAARISLNIVWVGDTMNDGARQLKALAEKIPHSSYTTAKTLSQTVDAIVCAKHRLYSTKAASVLLVDESASMQSKLGDSTRILAAQEAANSLVRILRSEAAAPQSARKMVNFTAPKKLANNQVSASNQRKSFSVGGVSYVL